MANNFFLAQLQAEAGLYIVPVLREVLEMEESTTMLEREGRAVRAAAESALVSPGGGRRERFVAR